MKPLVIYALCSLPGFLAIGGLVAREEYALANGREVLLDTRPVDPMSLFAGRYAQVSFAAETALESVPGPDPRPLNGTVVYTWLRLESGLHVPERVTLQKPEDPSVVFLRGRIVWPDRIDYNATHFYIPHMGRDPATAIRDKGGVQARVSVDPGGRVRLVDLIVEGLPYAEWNQRESR